ncbi:hypothetical protein NITMOv2_3372 [Nitrospira moscoviensis]|uniref:Uncharacterized protein n=1 Tax=Nitrospira moscoviensis TaxID=42253 RepID=A0A0K2GFM7_NITMO|nr:hypothetical protein NITMOv2_3372 [Nitrospira moscoviensis]
MLIPGISDNSRPNCLGTAGDEGAVPPAAAAAATPALAAGLGAAVEAGELTDPNKENGWLMVPVVGEVTGGASVEFFAGAVGSFVTGSSVTTLIVPDGVMPD